MNSFCFISLKRKSKIPIQDTQFVPFVLANVYHYTEFLISPSPSDPSVPRPDALLPRQTAAVHALCGRRCRHCHRNSALHHQAVRGQAAAVRAAGRQHHHQHQPHGHAVPVGRHADRLPFDAVADRAAEGHAAAARHQYVADAAVLSGVQPDDVRNVRLCRRAGVLG